MTLATILILVLTGTIVFLLRKLQTLKTESRKLISERKTAELDFKTLANNIPQMAWITDPQGMVTWYNNRWYQYTGTSEEHIESEAKGGSTHPDHLPKVLESWLESLRSGSEWENTFKIRSHDGSYRWFLSRAIPIKDASGQVVRWFGTNTDIDAQVNAEQELENLSKDLQDALVARDEFLSIASHELKTPLTTLKLQSQMFQQKANRGETKIYVQSNVDTFVEQTEKQATRLNRLVDDMLDIARIRSGNLTITPESFDLRDLIEEVAARMRPQFESLKACVPTLDLEGPVVGYWDKLRIEQVVSNLFTNAIRYGKGNPISVRLKASAERVTFSVEDRGIGIPKDAVEKIFERFERVADSSQISGLGLGLFITKQIIEAHDGSIWVESELGLGSTFSVELPLVPLTET